MSEFNEDIALERISTGVNGAEEDDAINISYRAIDVINNVRKENNLNEEYYLRFGVRGGGCAGMIYSIGFDTEVSEIDRIYDVKDFKMIIDNRSLFYFMGVTLDYIDSPEGSGFIFSNPSNFNACGCQA